MPPLHQAKPLRFMKPSHDHARCIARAMKEAEDLCAREGARFTGLRRQVLEIVWKSHQPVGAYDILATLSGDGRRPAPPTVYRALDFLLAHKLVHRIESQNAYVGCSHLEESSHAGQFLICRACGQAAEAHDPKLAKAIALLAESTGFTIEEQAVELTGLCPVCRKEQHAAG